MPRFKVNVYEPHLLACKGVVYCHLDRIGNPILSGISYASLCWYVAANFKAFGYKHMSLEDSLLRLL